MRIRMLLALLLLASPVFGEEACPLTEPQYLPPFSLSGAWLGSEVAFVDAKKDEVLLYSMKNGYLGTSAVTDDIQPFKPSVIRSVGKSFLLQLSGSRLVRLDETLRPRAMNPLAGRAVELGARSKAEGEVIDNIYAWNTVGPDVVACADVYQTEKGDWLQGYVRLRPGSRGSAQFLTQFSPEDPNRVYCRLGMDLITQRGTDAYILMKRDGVGIYRFDRNGSESALPVDLGDWPEISFTAFRDIPGIMRLIEASTMPVGLYTVGGDLVVLSRTPIEAGTDPIKAGTEWTLTRYSAETGEFLGRGVLPTRANHLTVVPGPSHWAFLERGAVRENWEHEKLFGIRYVPVSAIRSMPLDGGRICE